MRLSLTICLCLALNAQSQDTFLEKITTREGLSSNHITGIVQDGQGFLWIATSDGLNRFDGTEIKQFFHNTSDDQFASSLINNYIYAIHKLPNNKLAVATQAGLSFLDVRTSQFYNFYFNSNSALDEYNNIIAFLQTDTKGNLWAASRNCIFIFDKNLKLLKTFFSPFKASDASRKRLRFIDKMIPVSSGEMLVYQFNGWFVYSLHTNKGIPLQKSSYKQDLSFINQLVPEGQEHRFFPGNYVFHVFENNFIYVKPGKDSIMMISENGKSSSAIHFPYNLYPFILYTQNIVTIDSSKLLFLFHNYGLAEIEISWKDKQPVLKNISPIRFTSMEFITALRDRQNNCWLATMEDGLQKINPLKQGFKGTELHIDQQRIQSEVSSFSKFENNLWIATYGDGIYKKNLTSGKIEHFILSDNKDIPWPNFVWNIRQKHRDSLWVGTQGGLFWYHLPSKRKGRIQYYPGKPSIIDSIAITTQFTDSHGLVWMGLGQGNGVCYFDNNKKYFVHFPNDGLHYPYRYPTNIMEDNKGNVWFTSDPSHSLVKFNRQQQKFEKVPLPLSSRQISTLTSFWIENDSVMWIGTHTNGLIRFDMQQNRIKFYAHDNGIADSKVSSIFQDKRKRIWMVTGGALSVFNPATEKISNFDYHEGLPVDFPTSHFFYDKQMERLYAGGEGAFFYFNPDNINEAGSPRSIVITSMEVNGKQFMFGTSAIRFRPSQNDISISYAAIDLNNGPDTRYEYKLLGDDTSWIMAGDQRQINFRNLAPGDYTFMVRAGNHMGNWNHEAAMIQFHINKPFSKTALFYLLIIAGMAGIFYALYRFRVRQIMKTEQVRTEISRNLHDEVGSTLTNISLSTLLVKKQLENEPVVNRMLERIYQDSQLVSQSMREIVWSINPRIDTLGEALPRMLQYASEVLEAKGIELEAEVDNDIEEAKLSMQLRRDLYLIFKEAVNNIARHSHASRATIHVQLKQEVLYLTIADNGKGFNVNHTAYQNGIRNMKERALMHGWKLDMDSTPGEGSELRLKAHIA